MIASLWSHLDGVVIVGVVVVEREFVIDLDQLPCLFVADAATVNHNHTNGTHTVKTLG